MSIVVFVSVLLGGGGIGFLAGMVCALFVLEGGENMINFLNRHPFLKQTVVILAIPFAVPLTVLVVIGAMLFILFMCLLSLTREVLDSIIPGFRGE